MKIKMKSDLEIARSAKIKPIKKIAKALGIKENEYELYGNFMAKIDTGMRDRLVRRASGKYINVTAITPTPLGEGKTTTTIGLGMALNRIGENAIVAIRQPSMGPTFGIKGGAAGGGCSQVIPMEQFNLHMTGDIHAISVAHNLISAMLDNHLAKGNELGIDIDSITWPRVVDISDRALRKIKVGDNSCSSEFGVERKTRFDIAVASELMAIVALATDLADLRSRIGKIVLAFNEKGRPVTVEDIKATGSATVLLKEAIKPTLVQTLENTPALVHAGPFANIAHGNSSIIADQIGLKLADYLVTESGFGADIGMEKFMDIKCRYSGLAPDAVVLVATVRGVKYHSGQYEVVPGKPLPPNLFEENLPAIELGLGNLAKQIENICYFGVPVVVAINRFESDTEKEVSFLKNEAVKHGAFDAVESTVFSRGSKGGVELAKAVVSATNQKTNFKYLYPLNSTIKEKISTIATKIYGAKSVKYTKIAEKQIEAISANGFQKLPICMAKTHLSLSDDPKKVGRPENFAVTVTEIKVAAGAGFIYPLLGQMRTMPGLPTHPNAENIDIDEKGEIIGLS